jgi:farnesyl diphosphate synthase
VSVLGLEAARHHARELHQAAVAALARSGLAHTSQLEQLAAMVVNRDS